MKNLPRIDDDGRSVSVDLHGMRVEDAVDALLRVVSLAKRRGRSSVKAIHGSSTTDQDFGNRTIKTSIHQLVADGVIATSNPYFEQDYTIIGLPIAANPDPSPIRAIDILRS